MKKSIFYPALLAIMIANPAFSETRQEERERTIQSEIRYAKRVTALHEPLSQPSVMAKYLLINRQYCYFPSFGSAMPESPSPQVKHAWNLSEDIKLACQYAAYRIFQIATGAIDPKDDLQFTLSDMHDFIINSKLEIGLYSIMDK
jgi:hypothetical protein